MNSQKTTAFTKKLYKYKSLIDDAIKAYTKTVQKNTLQKYGVHSRVAVDAYLDILNRGGKRIRGALAMTGYEMCGGRDVKMITQAAMAVEMIHAYLLIIDDINDRSETRRGGPSAHALLADYHKKHNFSGDSKHFGESIAINAALIGNHAAHMTLANLIVDPNLLLNAISVLNYGLITTAHGQFNDIFNEVDGNVSEQDVRNVLEWKTAHYTFLNPLTFGMVLAGATCEQTDGVRDYCLNAGLAFQITDDILGTFGTEFESGKSPLDDMREGKRTLLTVYALEHANKADKNFLIQMLGNSKLSQKEFNSCKEILIDCGALKYAQEDAKKSIKKAVESLHKNRHLWSADGTKFLTNLAEFLLTRTS